MLLFLYIPEHRFYQKMKYKMRNRGEGLFSISQLPITSLTLPSISLLIISFSIKYRRKRVLLQTVVQIFEHWGGDNLQFYPIFNIGKDEPRPRLFSGEQITWRPKKKVFTRNGTLFLGTDLRSDAHQSQIIVGDADEDHSQIVGGYTAEVESRTQGSRPRPRTQKNPRPRPRTAFPRTDTLEAKDRNARGQTKDTSASALKKKKKKKKRSSQKFFRPRPRTSKCVLEDSTSGI